MSDPRNDRYAWRAFVEIGVKAPRYYWSLIFAEIGTMGPGFSLMSSLFVLGILYRVYVPFFTDIRAAGPGDPLVINSLFLLGLKRAWQHHKRRDFRRVAQDPGAIDRRAVEFLQRQGVPDRFLTEDWQWRLWVPLAMTGVSYPLEWMGYVVESSIVFVSGLWCFAIPGVWMAISERGAGHVFNDMVRRVNRLSGASQHTPSAGPARVAPSPAPMISSSSASAVVVNCPGCGVRCECDGQTGDLFVCSCGQEFQLP